MTKQFYPENKKVLVIIGKPLSHSQSSIMHDAAIRGLGMEVEYSYHSLELEEKELGLLCNNLRTGVIFGANVTIPYKTSIIPFLDELTEEARLIGAVNTLYMKNGKLVGENTDSSGFGLVLEENNIKVYDKKILILGYGGCAKAIAANLISKKAKKIDIYGRDRKKAQEFIKHFMANIVEDYVPPLNLDKNNYAIIINTTPLGMAGENQNKTPLDINFLKTENIVVDLIYNPRKTIFLEKAEKLGCKTLNGLEMLVNQGALSLEIWTGKKPNRQLMKQALLTSDKYL